jgi:hypothetical protein
MFNHPLALEELRRRSEGIVFSEENEYVLLGCFSKEQSDWV